MNRKLILTVLTTLLVVSSLSAETFSFTSDKLKSNITEGRERVRMTGNVVIESEKRIIKADQVDLWGKNYRYFSGIGSIYVEDKDNGIVLYGEEFFFDTEAEIMRLNGQVVMEDYENEMVVKCQYMENRTEEDLIILQIGVRILKEDIVCRSEFAIYNREQNILELSGLPVVYKSEDEYRADTIEVNLDTDEINLSGQVQGSLKTEEESPSEVPLESEETQETLKEEEPLRNLRERRENPDE